MASLELLYLGKAGGQPDPLNIRTLPSSPVHVRQSSSSHGGALSGEQERSSARGCELLSASAPRTAANRGGAQVKNGCSFPAEERVIVCCDEELETSFMYIDENVNLRLASPLTSCKGIHKSSRDGSASDIRPETLPELSLMSDEDLFSESSGSSVDYGFISAVTFLVAGISLVIISYTVPRDVQVDPESVSAREMERLEMESARVGAHLDRCVIAGLCLLTLGGVVLSSLLMVSMWKGEMYRRKAFAYSKRSTKLYGSINLKTKSSPSRSSAHLSPEEDIEETFN
ncbi:transmembrane protein 74 [Osmerus eperlanus]|uniref:transmembrane protein 74 n=1 Tax=Osmerus eperlanus TaxID=29151 RepID=UPI002E11C923